MITLAPEHLEDLKRSGVTDNTIEALGFRAIPPSDIKISGVESAYGIPYWTLEGKPNGFSRSRLFPSVTTSDGHSQKYHQAPGSAPQLYMPPLFSWVAVARNPECDVQFTEGEKKAAAMCERGSFCVGVAGTWNFRQRLETGERLVIPTLDLFVWKDRSVKLVPDSDAWREGKQLSVLSGFYALGQELISRGASVQFVRLPERSGVKVGLDDWLVVVGGCWEQEWSALERVALDDARLVSVAAWWQDWRQKHATIVALQSHNEDSLEVVEAAGGYTVRSSKYAVKLTFNRLTDARGSVTAELTVTVGAKELLDAVDIGLKSDTSHTNVSKGLKGLAPTIPWKTLIQKACSVVLRRHRHGEPIVVLEPTHSALVPFLLNPIVYRQHQTLLYAPGGSCKSYLALWFALLACHGHHHAGIAGVKSSVLYLDWELNAETVGGRLKALQAGHPELSQVHPFYRRCEMPLHQEAHQIAAYVAERGVTLLIIDSAAMACGGELSSPDAAINLQRALRKIGCASLVLAHVAKSVQEGQASTAYGTVFFRELARNVFELQKADGTQPVRVVLSQTKNNFGPKHDPIGLSLTFQGEAVRVDSYDVASEPEFEAKLPLQNRIRNLLEDGELRSPQDIADELGARLGSVKATLSKFNKLKWNRVGDYHGGKWTALNR